MAVIHCVITKQFTFRGKPERWSNGYNLQTTQALDPAYLKSVCDALVEMERPFTAAQVSYPYRVAGVLGAANALYSEEVGSPPVGIKSSGVILHPEVCVLAQSYIGPKRYLMKYYHGAGYLDGPVADTVQNQIKTDINASLVKLTNGTLPGSATACRPNGALATAPFLVDPYYRVHQLKRRGKRKVP